MSVRDPEHHARTVRSRRLFGGRPVLEFGDDATRRNFLRGAAVIGVGGTLAVAAGGVAFAQQDQDPATDLEILNYALTLEYLESEFYMRGLDGDLLSGRELELVSPIADHEQAHVEALTATINQLGGTPVPKPEFVFPDGTFTDKATFLMTASMFEELGVDAYHGQIGNIDSPEILAAAAAIAGVESRHAAILADLSGGNPFPAPFENSLPMQAVLDAASQFIQS